MKTTERGGLRRTDKDTPLAKYSHVLMSFKMKERGIHARSLLFWSLFHTRAQILISLYDLTSPWINYLILQYMWHMCMLPFYLPWAPHNLSLEVGWKEAMLWWGYIHIEQHERYYGEVKLWLVLAKIFPKPQTYGKKVEENEVNTIPLFNFPNKLWKTHQNS